MNSTQGRLRAVHLTTILVVTGLVAMLTSSCGSTPSAEPPVGVPEAGAVEPDASPTPDASEQPDTGNFIDAGPCIPQPIDCTGKCGPVRDACSGEVKLCGGCATGEVCDLQLHTCGIPKTKCSDFGADCGRVKTSCGEYLDCGYCKTGQECNPDTNKCGPAQAVTCQDLGYECGAAWLGSGDRAAKTNCGTCKDPNKSRCNSVFNVCEPACLTPWKNLTGAPATAAKKAFCDAARLNKGVECGTISDGCGDIINCSLSQGFSCPAGQGCGVRGVANRCEPFPTPPECEALGKNCGTLVSACNGKTISCGVCAGAGEVCNDNGVCGPPCQSKTCAQALPTGQICGAVSDGCKGTLNCACPGGGKCVGGTTCCQKKTCSQLVSAGQCGTKLDDGCGGTVNCNCPNGQNCPGAEKTVNTCCQPKTCGDFPGQCGQNLADGCGGVVQCGCGGGQSCIVGGPPGTIVGDNQPGTCCAETACTSGTCNTTVNSVCVSGSSFTCNNCPSGQICNGTTCCQPSGSCNGQCGITVPQGCGLPDLNCGCNAPFVCTGNTCTCAADTCDATYAGRCGQFPNGCNGTLSCNPCAGTATPDCSANGTCCKLLTCADYPANTCGTVSNGCGGFMNCDNCGGTAVCNPQGVCCTPSKTCTDYPNQCGTFSDGCNNTLQCNCAGAGNICNNGTCCQPLTCASLPGPKGCGTVNPGCGLPAINCNCKNSYDTCGKVTPGQCGCIPTGCLGRTGPAEDDGCGGKINCSG